MKTNHSPLQKSDKIHSKRSTRGRLSPIIFIFAMVVELYESVRVIYEILMGIGRNSVYFKHGQRLTHGGRS